MDTADPRPTAADAGDAEDAGDLVAADGTDLAPLLDPEDVAYLDELRSAASDPLGRERYERERDELLLDAEIHERLHRRLQARRVGNRSVVFTMRLDPDEVYALERRAASMELPVSVLARNYLRTGVGRGRPGSVELAVLTEVVTALETAAARLRELLA